MRCFAGLLLLGHTFLAVFIAGTNANSREGYFNSSSLAVISTPLIITDHIGLSFRTCIGGELFSQSLETHMFSLTVISDGLEFRSTSYAGIRTVTLLHTPVLDNKWHNVNIQYGLGNLTLSVEDETVILANSTYNYEIINEAQDFMSNKTVTIIGKNFNGCILEGPSIVLSSPTVTGHGILWDQCQLPEKICTKQDHCRTEPCLMNGVCIALPDRYECRCPPRYSGNNCEIDNGPPCDPKPCKNNGVCEQDDLGNYTCSCATGFTGRNCETVINPPICASSPCQNNAVCYVHGSQYACQCTAGFTGVNCEIEIEECASEPCQHGGTCVDRVGSYYCNCSEGYTGTNCEMNINECASNPCVHSVKCFDNYGSYTCQCIAGFTGKNCEVNINECSSDPCKNGGTCIDGLNSFECSCTIGHGGRTCESLTPNCNNETCLENEHCLEIQQKHQCVCKRGSPNNMVNRNCLELDICDGTYCRNGGTCFQADEKVCVCPPGYTGSQCEQDVDECSIYQPCINGICVNKEGGYDCFCKPGYAGNNCQIDFDECLSHPCKNGAKCLNQINKYRCLCPPGFTGFDCNMDINECASSPCINGGICADEIAAFSCNCLPGFTGVTCDINIDDCRESPCLNNGKCVDGINNYSCNCTNTGYEGERCEKDIDECEPNPCQNGGTCHDERNGYTCTCYPGYTGMSCDVDIDECKEQPCMNGGTCIQNSNISLYSPGSEIDSLRRPFSYEYASGYICLCAPGTSGSKCEIDFNECESNPCQFGQCSDLLNNFTCNCEPGYEGRFCENETDECLLYSPCGSHGVCQDKVADYFCECEPDYGGRNCTVRLSGCDDITCENNGSCTPYLLGETTHKFNCTCTNGFYGEKCEIVTTFSLNGATYVSMNTTREEGYDISVRFRTTLSNGVIAYGDGNTLYVLALAGGRLNLLSNLLNKLDGVFLGSEFGDGKWHKVFVAINNSHLVLAANEEQTIYPIVSQQENQISSSASFPSTFVGRPYKIVRDMPAFVGCMQDVMINGERYLPELHKNTSPEERVEVGCPRREQCKPNPCENLGICTDLWQDFKCICHRPFLGHKCQYNLTAATFRYENLTNSLVTIQINEAAHRAISSVLDISMYIRTTEDKGAIFYLTSVGSPNQTVIAAHLSGGALNVCILLNGTPESNPESWSVNSLKLADGNSHLIQVVRNYTLVQVKINGTEHFRKTISASGYLDVETLYLGGYPQSSNLSTGVSNRGCNSYTCEIGFKGVIQDVQITNGTYDMVVEFFPLEEDDLVKPRPFGNVSFDPDSLQMGVISDDTCRINKCANSGQCQITWNDFECVCEKGYKGKYCEDVEYCQLQNCPTESICQNLQNGFECIANSTFDGKNKYFTYSLVVKENYTNSQGQSENNLMIKYRSQTGGVILHIASPDETQLFTVSVYQNQIMVFYRFDSYFNVKYFGKTSVEGNWTTVYIRFKQDKIVAIIDDFSEESNDGNFSLTSWYNLLKTGKITLGKGSIGSGLQQLFANFPTIRRPFVSMFKGCLGEIRIENILVPLVKDVHTGNNTENDYFNFLEENYSEPVLGCLLCFDYDCKNNGSCINPKDSYSCDCPPGFNGTDCSTNIDECANNKCSNNSVCIDEIAGYRCNCGPGWTGKWCELDINECDPSPCKNGATCINQIAKADCVCPEGFTGPLCEEVKVITCQDEPCRNGSICLPKKDPETNREFNCSCSKGFVGIYCNIPYCEERPCINGICDTSGVAPVCSCYTGYVGRFCEIDRNECVPNPCLNGGKCQDKNDSFTCDCLKTGFKNETCSDDIDECRDSDSCVKANILRCVNIPGSYQCVCKNKFCGKICDQENPCSKEKPCLNGGICDPTCDSEEKYKCVCRPGFAGVICQLMEEASSSTAAEIAVIVGPVVGIVLIAGLVGLIIFVRMARKKRATRGTYSPSQQEYCNPRVEMDNVMKPPPEERLI